MRSKNSGVPCTEKAVLKKEIIPTFLLCSDMATPSAKPAVILALQGAREAVGGGSEAPLRCLLPSYRCPETSEFQEVSRHRCTPTTAICSCAIRIGHTMSHVTRCGGSTLQIFHVIMPILFWASNRFDKHCGGNPGKRFVWMPMAVPKTPGGASTRNLGFSARGYPRGVRGRFRTARAQCAHSAN